MLLNNCNDKNDIEEEAIIAYDAGLVISPPLFNPAIDYAKNQPPKPRGKFAGFLIIKAFLGLVGLMPKLSNIRH